MRIGGRLMESFDGQLSHIERRRLSYTQKMATVLGRRVWDNAGSPDVDSKRLMVSVGLALATTEKLVFRYDDWRAKGMGAATPIEVQMHMPNAPAAAVGLDHHAKAGMIAPVLADASGAAAIAQAWRHIVLGEADIAICGGVEHNDRGGSHRGVRAAWHVVDQQRRRGRRLPPVRQESRRHGLR